MKLKVGSRLRSTTCTTEIIVVRAPADDIDITCGGAPMTDDLSGDPVGTPPAAGQGGTLMGKRYTDAANTVEVLCTKPGNGAVAVGGEELALKEAKPLPASD